MSPGTKRIIWILVSALFIAAAILVLWLWYLGKEQASQNGTEGGGATSINSTTVPASKLQLPFGLGSLVSDITGVIGGVEKLLSPASTADNTSTSQNGQYNYPVYSGTATTIPPGGNTGVNETIPPNETSCIPSCSCGADGTQVCTASNCQVTTNTCAQGSSCVACYGGIGGPATTTPVGGQWIPGGGVSFNPTPINEVSSSSPTGSGNIFSPTTGGNASGGSGSSLTGDLLGIGVAAAGCYALIATEEAQEKATTAAGLAAGLAAGTASGVAAGIATAAATGAVPVVVTAAPAVQAIEGTQAGAVAGASQSKQLDTLTSCLTQALARVALDKITASTVNWIDSGFNGSPTFVQNYQQFFSDVANQAANNYLQSSPDLAFLCSPFALQVKIAVATSFAASQGGITPTPQNSCTLSQVTSNISNFLNGDFASGGWNALISFTNEPTNNPFGAYIQASAGIQNAVFTAKQNAALNISPEGFLNMQKVIPGSCTGTTGSSATQSSSVGNTCPSNCKCDVTTPGTVIASALDKALGTPVDQLNAAQDIDQVISALMSQLIQTAFQGGVSNLSGTQTSGDANQASASAQEVLAQMEGDTSTAQQYGYTEQGAIGDIQNAQSQLQTAVNCWASAATSTLFSSAQQAQAAANASSSAAQITSLQAQVDTYNTQITIANSAIALLQQLQTSILNASSLSDVQTVQNTYTADQTNGSLITASDLVTAQQDRTTLQSQLATLNQATGTQIQECYAFGTQTQ